MIFVFLLASSTYGQTAPTVLDGVYTADQATKGEAQYEAQCRRCHEGNDPEGPTLVGRTFVDRWREDPLDTLFSFMRTRMPPDGSATLVDSAYLHIIAFLLLANEYPAGSKELTLDSLERIRMVGKDGPRPLPPNTLVKLTGCLTQDAQAEWFLTRAGDPVRSREGRETTAEELKKSAAAPLGSHTFRLQNFSNIRLDFKPDPFKGHKVQVKGVLIRQSSGERISLVSLESVAGTCGG